MGPYWFSSVDPHTDLRQPYAKKTLSSIKYIMYNQIILSDPQTVQAQIKYLVELCETDAALYIIKRKRGKLPDIIREIKDEVSGLEEKVEVFNQRIKELKKAIESQQEKKKTTKELIKKYEAQKKTAQNEKLYNIINEDLEIEILEDQLIDKKINEHSLAIKVGENKINALKSEIKKKNRNQLEKEKRLREIDTLSNSKEKELLKKRSKVLKSLDEQLYENYEDIHQYKPNVVVNIVNEACNGCFVKVPPQIQLNVKKAEAIFHCEYCSRLFAYLEEPVVVPPKKKIRRSKRTLAAMEG